MLVRGHAEGKLEQQLVQLAKPKLLIMDEFGYLPFEPAAQHVLAPVVFEVWQQCAGGGHRGMYVAIDGASQMVSGRAIHRAVLLPYIQCWNARG